ELAHGARDAVRRALHVLDELAQARGHRLDAAHEVVGLVREANAGGDVEASREVAAADLLGRVAQRLERARHRPRQEEADRPAPRAGKRPTPPPPPRATKGDTQGSTARPARPIRTGKSSTAALTTSAPATNLDDSVTRTQEASASGRRRLMRGPGGDASEVP